MNLLLSVKKCVSNEELTDSKIYFFITKEPKGYNTYGIVPLGSFINLN